MIDQRQVVMVFGGNDLVDDDDLFLALNAIDCAHVSKPIGLLITSDGPGAAAMAREWAFREGVDLHIDNLSDYGSACGNAVVAHYRLGIIIAVEEGITSGFVAEAKQMGVKIVEIHGRLKTPETPETENKLSELV